MANGNETHFWLGSSSNTVTVSNTPTYTFGFTSSVNHQCEEPDPFDEWVREVRKSKGIVDPEPEKPKCDHFTHYWSRSGQLIWNGTLTVSNPRFANTLRGVNISVSTGSTNDNNE